MLNNTDVIRACTKERANTKWMFYTLTSMTVFATLLRVDPKGPKGALLPEPPTIDHTVNCVTYKENTSRPYKDNLCLFRALVFHLHRNGGPEKVNSKIFTLFLGKIGGTNPASFQGVCMIDFPIVDDLVQVSIFLYDIDFDDEDMIGELAKRSVGRDSNARHCSTTTLQQSHFFGFDVTVLFKAHRCPSYDIFFNRASRWK